MYKSLLRYYNRLISTGAFERSAEVAFYFVFAFFPLLYCLVNIAGLLLGSTTEMRAELFSYLYRIMPDTAFELVRVTVAEIIESSSPGKLILGLGVTLWSASAGIDGLRAALNAAYGVRERRQIWTTRGLSIGVTLLLITLMLFSSYLVYVIWGYTGGSHPEENAAARSLIVLRWASIVAVVFAQCMILYRLLPDIDDHSWKRTMPGAIAAVMIWLILTFIFRLYIQNFNTYNRAYGSLGAVMILMFWLYLAALALMLGGVINAEFMHHRKSRGQEPSPPADAD
ncbi:MAG: YihY/virulence factor BrkB family protein [Acidobacteria bacterium]|nr:YihY/virulence factor BrkB family protein [Acidobacteriota bacterium]